MRSGFIALALACGSAIAQSYPAKPIRIIIANPPGVPNDTIARGISQYLGPRIGQPIIVENRPGADGAIGMENCARSAPDGYSVCFAAQGAIVVNAFLRKLPYDPVADYVPIIHMGYFDSGLVVHPSVPARSYQELFEMAKAKPNAVTWGVFSFNSSGNFYAEWMRKMRDLHFYVVPYKAPPQMLQALVTGEVNAGVTSLGSIEKQLGGGKLRLLAVTSEQRHPSFPSTPTFAEAGIKLPLRPWFGIVGPTGIPRDIVGWMNAEVGKLAVEPEFRERLLTANGIVYQPNTPEDFAAFLKRNREEFGELLKIVPVKPN